jgi:hypothetical protein
MQINSAGAGLQLRYATVHTGYDVRVVRACNFHLAVRGGRIIGASREIQCPLEVDLMRDLKASTSAQVF